MVSMRGDAPVAVRSAGRRDDRDGVYFDAALAELVAGNARGEAKLVDAVERVSGQRRVFLITALGEADGPLGVTTLRSIVTDRSARVDERCVGLVALAKRAGPAASGVFVACLTDSRAAVRRYALRCLACVGDASGWATVYRRLRNLLAGPPLSNPTMQTLVAQSDKVVALGYLARHSGTARCRAAVVDLVHSEWAKLCPTEQEWLETYWPACVPGCSPAAAVLGPSPDSIATWMSHPLLLPLYWSDL